MQVFSGTATPMAEQIAAFGEASVVVAAHGAALAHMIFMKPGTAVVEIGYTSCASMCFPHTYYYSMAMALGLRFYSSLAPQGHYKSPLHPNITEVLELVATALV
jgi:capsular polysaccharide biosynthesis protein